MHHQVGCCFLGINWLFCQCVTSLIGFLSYLTLSNSDMLLFERSFIWFWDSSATYSTLQLIHASHIFIKHKLHKLTLRVHIDWHLAKKNFISSRRIRAQDLLSRIFCQVFRNIRILVPRCQVSHTAQDHLKYKLPWRGSSIGWASFKWSRVCATLLTWRGFERRPWPWLENILLRHLA